MNLKCDVIYFTNIFYLSDKYTHTCTPPPHTHTNWKSNKYANYYIDLFTKQYINVNHNHTFSRLLYHVYLLKQWLVLRNMIST